MLEKYCASEVVTRSSLRIGERQLSVRRSYGCGVNLHRRVILSGAPALPLRLAVFASRKGAQSMDLLFRRASMSCRQTAGPSTQG